MRLAAFWPAFVLAAGASADSPRLNVDNLVEEALRNNAEILAAQKKYEASRQRPAQERALPEPMISLGWNSSGNPLPGAGLGSAPTANIGVMASQEIPYPGKLRLKALVAAREADAEAQNYRAAQLGVISRLKQAFYRLQHAYAMRGVLERNRESLRSLLRATEARYSVGKAAQADVFRAQTQLTLIETRLAQVERDHLGREAEIIALLNRHDGAALGVPDQPHMAPLTVTAEELLVKARDGAPSLAREQKMVERADVALALGRKNNRPDFAVNGGYYNMGAMPPMYMFRADVKIPLHSSRTAAEIAERAQQAAESRHSYEAAARSLEFRIRDEFLGAETAQKLLDLYSKTVLPQARLATESSLAAYQTGAMDFAAVLANQVAAYEYEMNYHEQMEAFHIALARLEEITGVELTR